MAKKKYTKKSYESDQSNSDVSANIYHSMLISDAWKDLKPRAKVVYLAMKDQKYSQRRKPISIENDSDLFHYQEDDFYFNRAKWCNEYGLCAGNHTSFESDVKALIEHGFIEIVRNGKTARVKSIYRYSDKWKSWKNKAIYGYI